MVASYDLRPGNGAGPIFWKVRDRRRNRRLRRIKKEEKIQIGKVSKNKNTNKPHSHSAEINKCIAGTNYLLMAPEPARGGRTRVIACTHMLGTAHVAAAGSNTLFRKACGSPQVFF